MALVTLKVKEPPLKAASSILEILDESGLFPDELTDPVSSFRDALPRLLAKKLSVQGVTSNSGHSVILDIIGVNLPLGINIAEIEIQRPSGHISQQNGQTGSTQIAVISHNFFDNDHSDKKEVSTMFRVEGEQDSNNEGILFFGLEETRFSLYHVTDFLSAITSQRPHICIHSLPGHMIPKRLLATRGWLKATLPFSPGSAAQEAFETQEPELGMYEWKRIPGTNIFAKGVRKAAQDLEGGYIDFIGTPKGARRQLETFLEVL